LDVWGSETVHGVYYLIDANDLDEAIAIAARMPSARNGSIEVRALPVGQRAARG
jgi:hypothetical protein